MRLLFCLAILLIARDGFAQIPDGRSPAPVSILQQLEAVTTNEFPLRDGELTEHFTRDHRARRLLVKLHELLHQDIEALRPAGKYAYVVFEGTDEEYRNWPERASIEAGWPVVRRPGPLGWVVAIGKTHWSEAGYLRGERLRQLMPQTKPRATTPVGGWKISKLVMHSQPTCTPCTDWKAAWLSLVLADGVEYDERGPNGRNTPWFEVTYCNGDECKVREFRGPVSYLTMKALQ